MLIVQILAYISLLLFLIMVISKIVKLASTPVHLRWELYPVPHEKGGRARYGGSRLEDSEWWNKKQEKNSLRELTVMIPEIFLLKGVWEHNRSLWIGSFPLHFGLYLLICNIFLGIISAIFSLTGSPIQGNPAGIHAILYYIISIFAWAGSILGLFGAIRMFFLRAVESNLRNYATPSHFFNIIFLGVIYLTNLLWLIGDPGYVASLTSYYQGLITFSALPALPAMAIAHAVLSILFIAYLPLTHMTHFFTKYFTYHNVRWDDEPNLPGGKIQERISKQLNYVVTWAAPHIAADGKKTWLAIATTNPWEAKNDNKD